MANYQEKSEKGIVEVKTEKGTFKYKKWVWDLAWWVMFLEGALFGAYIASN